MGIFNRKIVSVEILSATTDSRKSASSTLLRGAVGGALLGPVGALAGGLSGKNKNTDKTTFLITYDDGYTMTQTVQNNGVQFNMYMKLVNENKKKENNVNLEDNINDKYEKAKKLKELLDSNLITQEEFEKERQKIFE